MHINANGRKFNVEVEKEATLIQLKMKIMDEMGIPPQHQKMTFEGQVLNNNDALLSSYGVNSTSEVQ